MYIEKFLTEYDDSLTGELNVDPLGQLVIWSSWGQDIFHSRITSIANDVRQYTLNLLHHSVLRQLLVDEKLQTSGAMKGLYPKKQLQEFRVACLIHLENIYIYSMLAAEKEASLSLVCRVLIKPDLNGTLQIKILRYFLVMKKVVSY